MIQENRKDPTHRVDPDFSAQVIADLYRFYPRRLWLATLLATVGGIFGFHRFYCWRPLTGVLMLLTLGGGFVWWIRDLFRLRAMVADCNAQEQRRLAAGLAPRGMGFLPPRDQLQLDAPPRWASRHSSRKRVVGSALLLWLIGLSLGAVSGATGSWEPVLVLVVFIAASLLAARWKGMAAVPALNALTRWVHRLRLYYHTVDPGDMWLLATRPLFGLIVAPWRPRARMEVRLYLEFGAVMALPLAALDAVELLGSDSLWAGIGLLISDFAQTLVYIYLFVAPAGALLNTQILLARRDLVVWCLSAVTLYSVHVGHAIVTG